MTHAEEPQQRDTGSDKPGGGPADRPAGTVDEDANPPLSNPDDTTTYGGTGTLPPQDTGSAIPPYEGRTEGSETNPRPGSGEAAGFGTKGDTGSRTDKPAPAKEDGGVGPAHTPGTGRAEDKS